ncbi:DoxX family membrane protein [Streptomyces sp. B1866]|uniref:DoxX family protein n=1 Tax=Streptomyces sp. B1866 TaxID=3075431 RepID=UPI00288FD0D3|nr:DoxX family membrane protein [Streptomyces sp. B1866]MDT3395561.1 DoxX family membrane protein [Streptomyces sp. B1866]
MPLKHRQDLGLLALRASTGGVLFAHGAQKLFGWFGGHGLAATGQAMEQMGFVPGRTSALAAGLGEAGGGALLAAGLATPAAGAAAAGAMAAAVAVQAPAGFFNMEGGFEFPAFLGAVAAGLGLAGPGRLSLDHLTGHRLDRPWVVALGFAASTAACAVVLRCRAATLRAGSSEEGERPDGGGPAGDGSGDG